MNFTQCGELRGALAWRFVTLDLYADPVELTKALVDIPSPSHHEEAIADAIEEALRGLDVEVARYGNTVCARTNRGLDSRVVLADTSIPFRWQKMYRITWKPLKTGWRLCGAVALWT